MPYLFIKDCWRFIQSDNLQQVINKDLTILEASFLDAEQVAKELLIQKYVLDDELTPTEPYDPSVVYKAGERVYLDAPAYSATTVYIQGELTLQGGNVYVSNVAIVVPEAFNPLHWIFLGPQYHVFYVALPKPAFILNNFYLKGDMVFWKGSIYTRTIATSNIDHSTLLQYQQYMNVPLKNIFPDDPKNGVQYWGIGTPYSVPAGTLYPDPVNQFAPQYSQTFATSYLSTADGTSIIDLSGTLLNKQIIQIENEVKPLTNSQFNWNPSTGILTLIGTTVDNGKTLFIIYSNTVVNAVLAGWVMADNRNRSLVRHAVSIALYIIHDRIAPRNIPELRKQRYEAAIKWLEDAAKGNLTAGLPVIQPRSGGRVRWGSNIKNINGY